MGTIPERESDAVLMARMAEARDRLTAAVGVVIVGQAAVVELVAISLLCRAHCVLEGVPGLAKTILVQSMARALDLTYSRIQFTPDVMPSDITGAEIIQEDPVSGRRQYEFMPGPIFAQLVLADEINRTPPKTQAALLEAMQERRVTCRGRTHELPDPFLVMATQNPIEQEGTYRLPEAQLDRFMFMIQVGYPTRDEEIEILRRTTGTTLAQVPRAFSRAEILRLQELVRAVPVADAVLAFATDVVRATRPGSGLMIPEATMWIQWGAGPRASQMLVLAAKARALLHGRLHPSRQDVAALAAPVLRHRMVLTFAAQAEGLEVDTIISRIVAKMLSTNAGEGHAQS